MLEVLLQRPGELVTREELKQRLWPSDTFVDFENSINAAIRRLRDALDDSASTPRFIETLPRRGYRFIYPLTPLATESAGVPRSYARLAIVSMASLLLAVLLFGIPGVRDRLLGRRVPGKSMRVAVLPLKNLSGDAEQDYFAAGMTEMLITELGRISALQVTSHQSVLGYVQSNEPVPQIARELGVDAVVEGTVQRAGDRVRVTVNFVQAQPENHLLAQSYEKDARHLFEVQADVARAIAGAIRVNLPESSPPSSSPAGQVPPEAIEAYLRGKYLLAKGRDSDRDEARVYFEKAIEIDPSFARPYAALAVMYAPGDAVRRGGMGEGRKLTRQWAEKALQLDDSLAEAHAALAWLAITDWDFRGAERESKRALELNPSLAIAHVWYAQFLGLMRRYPEAFAHTEVALRLSPGSPNIVSHAVYPYFTGGRMDDAMSHWRSITELHPDYVLAHYFLALGYMKKGMYREALAEAEESFRLDSERENPLVAAVLASAYAKAGEREKALQILHALEELRRRRGGGYEAGVAGIYVALGDNERALALLEEAYRARRPALPFVDVLPQYDPLRPDPRFQDLLRRMGLSTTSRQ